MDKNARLQLEELKQDLSAHLTEMRNLKTFIPETTEVIAKRLHVDINESKDLVGALQARMDRSDRQLEEMKQVLAHLNEMSNLQSALTPAPVAAIAQGMLKEEPHSGLTWEDTTSEVDISELLGGGDTLALTEHRSSWPIASENAASEQLEADHDDGDVNAPAPEGARAAGGP